MREINCLLNTEKVLDFKVYKTTSFFERLKGLMFQKKINYGLLIKPCNSIHTFFMKTAIDVCFLTKDGEVLEIKNNMLPWRMTRMYFKAHKVLEGPAGSLKVLKKGMVLRFPDV